MGGDWQKARALELLNEALEVLSSLSDDDDREFLGGPVREAAERIEQEVTRDEIDLMTSGENLF